jgi:hypothetical protein
LFGRGDFKALAGGLREETLWLLGEAGVEEFGRIAAISSSRESAALADSGVYVMCSGDCGHKIVIDCGPFGAGAAGHRHADALSITAAARGRDRLIDSGTFEYVGGGFERDRFRSTRAHNTLIVDGVDQAEPGGPFAWKNLPNVTAEGWITGKAFDLFVGSHDGYLRLPSPVIHRRFVFSLKSGFCLVRDLAIGAGEHQLDLLWHIAPEFREQAVQKNYFVYGDEGLRFVTVEGSAWKRNVERHPHSPVYGCQDQHSALHFSVTTQLPAEFVTLLLPSPSQDVVDHKLTRTASEGDFAVSGYRYQAGNEEHNIFFGDGSHWNQNGWSSDAEFLYAARSGSDVRAILIWCNGTSVDWNGRRLVNATRPVSHCEIAGQEAPEVVSSDNDSITVDATVWKTFTASSAPESDFKLT